MRFPGAELRLIQPAHLLWGIAASVLLTLLIGYYLIRRTASAPLFGGSSPTPGPARQERICRRRSLWLVQVRWIVIVLLLSAIGLFGRFATFFPPENLAPLLICAFVLFLLNSFYAFFTSRVKNTGCFLIFQLVVDLFLLTALLYFSGGVANPFSLSYIFSVITAGTLLERRQAIWITFLTAALFLTLFSLDYLQLIQHPLSLRFPQDPLFAAGQVVSFFMAIAFAGYLTILLHDKIRRDEGKMVQASKMAAMGEMAGRIVHEINNPMGIVSTRIKLILEKEGKSPELPPKILSDLEKIDRQCERITALTADLLSLGRPKSGIRTLLNVNDVVDETLILLEPEICSRGIRIIRRLTPASLVIFGNKNEMHQVLLNLIGNALDAMKKDDVLRVETRMGKDHSEIAISDTGTGIPSELLTKIFEPFFTTKKSGKGTGLGLSIAEGIVRSHDGNMEIESKEGEGTTVTLRLPRITESHRKPSLSHQRLARVDG